MTQSQPIIKQPKAGSVFFVHGMWHAKWCWDGFVDQFKLAGYAEDALRPINLRYHGEPEVSPRIKSVRLAEFESDIVLASAGLPRPLVMVGHSLGAYLIGRCLGQLQPDAVILLAPASRRSAWGAFGRSFLPDGSSGRVFWRSAVGNLWNTIWGMVRRSPYQMVKTPERAGALLFSPNTQRTRMDLVRAIHARLQEESFTASTQMLCAPSPFQPANCPALVLGAEFDRAVSAEALRETARRLRADWQILPGLGHDLMLDVGYERVAEIMLNWLDQQALAAPPRVA